MLVALLWQRWNQIMLSGVLISPDAEIGPGIILHTAYGLQISPVKIGSNCTFNSQVLIGTVVKSIGDNCYFGPGCKIVGECKIGNNVLVVANSVALHVPDNTTIMGIPARIKLPGGRLRKMPWKTLDAKKNGEASKRKVERRSVAQGSRAAEDQRLRRRTRGDRTLDFAWTDEQAAFRKDVIRFAQEGTERRRGPRRTAPRNSPGTVWKKCADFGIQGFRFRKSTEAAAQIS